MRKGQRLGDRCSVCTTGVGESDNCHVASFDNYDEHQINVEINSVVLKMACFGTWICATDIGWGLDVGGLILRFVLQLGKHANGLRTRWFFVELLSLGYRAMINLYSIQWLYTS